MRVFAEVSTASGGGQRGWMRYSSAQDELAALKEQTVTGDSENKRLQIAQAQQVAAEANQMAEQERLRRVQLQRSVLNRMIGQICDGDKCNWDGLKPYKGVNVVFRHSPEREPGMFSGNLSVFPMNAGWNFLGQSRAKPDEIPDGVTVEAYCGTEGETDFSKEAGKSFADFMSMNGIERVRFLLATPGKLAPKAVEVLVGQMPDPFRQ